MALELKRAFVWADTCTGSSEPMRVSLTASFTATALDIVGELALSQGQGGYMWLAGGEGWVESGLETTEGWL